MGKENDWSADERMLGKLSDCSFYLVNLFPEFQIPYLHFFPWNSRPLTYTFAPLQKRLA